MAVAESGARAELIERAGFAGVGVLREIYCDDIGGPNRKRVLMSASQDNLRLLIRSGSHTCALPLSDVVETMRPLPIAPLAGAPEGVLGMSLVRGVAVPVVDLAALLGDRMACCTRFVCLRVSQRVVALAVDSVIGIHELAGSRLAAMPPLLQAFRPTVIAAITALDAELILMLRSAGLIPSEEAIVAQEAHDGRV